MKPGWITLLIINLSLLIPGHQSYSQGKNNLFLKTVNFSYFGKSVMHPGLKLSSPLIKLRITDEFIFW